MANFDLTPLVKGGGYKVIFRLFLWSVPLVLILFVFGNHDFAVSFFRGVVIGVMDTVVMFHGMKQALPYVGTPRKGVKNNAAVQILSLRPGGQHFCVDVKDEISGFRCEPGISSDTYIFNHQFIIFRVPT